MKNLSTFNIQNRRYLGNKSKLMPFILDVVRQNCCKIDVVADIFAGTGSVASAFNDKIIITNDLMQSNFICNLAWFGSEPFDKTKIAKILKEFNNYNELESNYMSENFSNTYFSKKVCSKIGYIRENIENKFKNGEINERERAILITSLLYAMDKIAATCGHYDAYRKGAILTDNITLAIPLVNSKNNPKNRCFNEDANKLARQISADLVYIDPPYNSRQYSDSYHLLENVATWQKPKVSGVAKKMDRLAIKSQYCGANANEAFADLIENTQAKYILFSYNNMANKGNDRSNAKISDEVIMDTLGKKGKVLVFLQKYKAFSTGKSEIKDNAERLFLCEVS